MSVAPTRGRLLVQRPFSSGGGGLSRPQAIGLTTTPSTSSPSKRALGPGLTPAATRSPRGGATAPTCWTLTPSSSLAAARETNFSTTSSSFESQPAAGSASKLPAPLGAAVRFTVRFFSRSSSFSEASQPTAPSATPTFSTPPPGDGRASTLDSSSSPPLLVESRRSRGGDGTWLGA
jgi:hypothetical protein